MCFQVALVIVVPSLLQTAEILLLTSVREELKLWCLGVITQEVL